MGDDRRVLKIKKYSNRRFYDNTRSCHVTLREMHDLICEGFEVLITDGGSGENITNMVLTQIILDRDPPKLNILPPGVLHQVIRTQQQYLGSAVEQFFSQMIDSQRTTQEQWVKFAQGAFGMNPAMSTNPLDWTRKMMEAFAGAGRDEGAEDEARNRPENEVEALRREVVELRELVQRMSEGSGGG